jgi:hypothetical protein
MIAGTGQPALSQRSNLLDRLGQKPRLAPEPHAAILRLGNAVHLTLAPNVIFKLGDQRQDTHHQLARARACVDCRVIEETRIVPFADLILQMIIGMYEDCFSESTRHMKIFSAVIMVRYPDVMNPTQRAQVTSLALHKALAKQSRSQCLSSLPDFFEIDPELGAEREVDLATLQAGQDFVLERM